MKFIHIDNHRINFNEKDYIVVDGIQFGDINNFYPNIRSIKIHINNQIYTYSNDDTIKTIIKYYLQTRENVKLINLISNRIINKNWFECYLNESSRNVLGSQHVQIKPELLDEKSNIKITDLYTTKTLLENGCKYENEFPTYPIWHINGNHDTRAKYCQLYCHYDIMLHILSLRFVEIKSQILNLSTTDFLKAVINDETIEERIEYSREELMNMIEKQKQIIKQKDKRIFDLEECMREIRNDNNLIQNDNKELKAKIDNILKDNERILNKLDATHDELINTRVKLDETHNELKETRHELTENIVHNTNLLTKIDNRIETDLNGRSIDNSITNSICKIIIMAKFSKSINISLFVNIRRQTTSKLNSEIKKYKDRGYKLVYEKEVPNAMSVAKSIFNDEKNAKKYNIKKLPQYQSKYQTDYVSGRQLKKDFDEIVESYLNVPSTEIRNIIKEELEPVHIKIEEIQDNILKLPEKLNHLKITAEDYYSLKGKFIKGSNGYYREVLEDENGILYIQLNKKQIEEIIRGNISEILYKNNKNDKIMNTLKLN